MIAWDELLYAIGGEKLLKKQVPNNSQYELNMPEHNINTATREQKSVQTDPYERPVIPSASKSTQLDAPLMHQQDDEYCIDLEQRFQNIELENNGIVTRKNLLEFM